MSENIKIRVVIEEVVVDFEGTVGGHYSDASIKALLADSINGALELHAKRKELK